MKTLSACSGKLAIMAAVVFAAGMTARATSITILNPSFELQSLSNGSATNTSITDWNQGAGGDDGVFNPHGSTTYFTTAGLAEIDGNNVAYSNGSASVISQVLTTDFAPDMTYTLSLLVGDRSDLNNTATTFSYGLYDGTTSAVLDTSGPVTETQAFGATLANKGQFITETLTYTTGDSAPAHPIGIEFSASSVQYDFDNVTLNRTPVSLPSGPTGVPLPSAAATMPALLGLAGMIGYWRSSKRRSVA